MSDKRYNLTRDVTIDDESTLEEFKNLIYAEGDIRPTWQGGGNATTNKIEQYYYIAGWANKHWGYYRAFLCADRDIDYDYPYNILDLGCGSGFCTRNLAEVFPNARIVGIDNEQICIDFCNKYNSHQNIMYVLGDITEMNLGSKVFDYIFLAETLEHISHDKHVPLIQKCIDAMKDERSDFFISTPNSQEVEKEKEKGHIGILNDYYFNIFEYTYRRYIDYVRYYDQSKLLDGDPVQFSTFNHRNGGFQICLKNYMINI